MKRISVFSHSIYRNGRRGFSKVEIEIAISACWVILIRMHSKTPTQDGVRPHFHMADLGPLGMVALVGRNRNCGRSGARFDLGDLPWTVCFRRLRGEKSRRYRGSVAPSFVTKGTASFSLRLRLVTFSVLIIALLALVVFRSFGIFADNRAHGGLGVGGAIAIGCVMLLWFLFAIFFAVATQFMVPVMYRQRCRATAPVVQVARLVMNHLGAFVLLILFSFVLFLAFVLISAAICIRRVGHRRTTIRRLYACCCQFWSAWRPSSCFSCDNSAMTTTY